jgi:two-component system sensor histidine kinase EvgS
VREREAATGRARCWIFGFTANAQVEEKQRCRAAGMDDCLFKPILLEDLRQALNGAASDARAIEPPAVEIDLSALEQLAAANPAILQRLRQEVLNNLQLDLQRLEALSQQRDRAGLADLAHHILGAAQMIGAARVAAACRVLQQACPDADTAGLVGAVEALRETLLGLAQRLQG